MNMMKLNGTFDAIDPFLDAVAHWQQDYLKLDDAPFSAEFLNTLAVISTWAGFNSLAISCRWAVPYRVR